MSIPEQIFKSYDIRGLVESELSEEAVEAIGRAFVELLGAKNVAIGYDMRPSSPILADAVMRGVAMMGANVVNIGRCSSPMLNFAVGMHSEIDGGIMVTASHNPAGWNGLKLVRGNVVPLGKGAGMDELKELAMNGDLQDAQTPGAISTLDTKQEYLDYIFKYIGAIDVSDMTIVADAGNGMVGMLLPEMGDRLHVNIIDLYWDLDGTFPNHEANPIKKETLADLQKSVIENNAQVGFAYDADGDRIGVVDEVGAIISNDIITALIAEQILKENPGATIFCNVQCGRDVKDVVESNGGTFTLTPVGHSHIKRMISEVGAKFAGELSGHFYYADFFNVESTVLTTLLILRIMKKATKPLSELVMAIKKHHASGEINFIVKDKDAIIEEIKSTFTTPDSKLIDIDGIRLEFATWWLGVRSSNTEPVLRLNVEAETKDEMEKRRDEIIEVIESSEHGGEAVK